MRGAIRKVSLGRISEAKTRNELIDPALGATGWNLHNHQQVGLEILVDGYD
jgi:hypothetical protein